MPEARARVVLAFDFGLRRIGVACGDTISNAAAPASAIQVTERGIDWSAIERLLQRYQPDLLVVGSPRHADGSPSALGERADQFAAALGAPAGRSSAPTSLPPRSRPPPSFGASAPAASAAGGCNMPTSTAPQRLSFWNAGCGVKVGLMIERRTDD
jgi:hypothetical protein